MENSCLMLMMSLWTPIDLDFVLDEADLAEKGIEGDPHITAFYSGTIVPKENTLSDIKEFLGTLDYENFLEFLKTDSVFPVYDVFGLDKFENKDFDVLILRLKPGNRISKVMGAINAGFTEKYDLSSDFGVYKPHLTLSYLLPGTADRYLSDVTLDKVLNDTKVSYDDFVMSYGTTEGENKQWYLTNFNCTKRHLRHEKLLKNKLKLG